MEPRMKRASTVQIIILFILKDVVVIAVVGISFQSSVPEIVSPEVNGTKLQALLVPIRTFVLE